MRKSRGGGRNPYFSLRLERSAPVSNLSIFFLQTSITDKLDNLTLNWQLRL